MDFENYWRDYLSENTWKKFTFIIRGFLSMVPFLGDSCLKAMCCWTVWHECGVYGDGRDRVIERFGSQLPTNCNSSQFRI